MGRRRISRELALRALFQADVAGTSAEEAIESGIGAAHHPPPVIPSTARNLADVHDFARLLVLGTLEHRPRIDRAIQKYARGWTLERMANVDRSILRLAIFELLYLPDIPPSVTVDEAVELAKKYSTAESGRFVNGILGNLIRDLQARPELVEREEGAELETP